MGRRSVSTGITERAKILSGEKKSWLDLERKTRGDAISTEHKQLIFNFWSHEASRPTGDKKRCYQEKNREKTAHRTREARAGKNANRGIYGVPGTIPRSKD